MGLARKKSIQKHQPVRPASAGSTATAAMPSRLHADLLVMAGGSSVLLTNQIDNVQTATFSSANGQLSICFHLLVLFSDAPISGFRLVRSKLGLEASELATLETTNIGSPGVGSLHPALEWSSNSRFVVDTTIAAPGLVPGDLLTIAAQVGDQLRPVSRIYITGKAAAAAAEGAEA